MIYPIVAYGDPVLRVKAKEITPEYPNLRDVIANMFETMYGASGVGLAAPQVGMPIRVFLVDASPFADDEELSQQEQDFLADFKRVFINARKVEESGEKWAFNEGCLSIPDVREDVSRQDTITLEYQDEEFNTHTETFTGLAARVIQHEYDHIEGVLFTDYLSPLKKRLLKGKLGNISKGKVQVDYRMKFPLAKKKR
jgi:peptide deformylase